MSLPGKRTMCKSQEMKSTCVYLQGISNIQLHFFNIFSGVRRTFKWILVRKRICLQTDESTELQTEDPAEWLGGKLWIFTIWSVFSWRWSTKLQVCHNKEKCSLLNVSHVNLCHVILKLLRKRNPWAYITSMSNKYQKLLLVFSQRASPKQDFFCRVQQLKLRLLKTILN